MAELKFQEYSYENEEYSQSVELQALQTPKRPEVVTVPLSPTRKLKRISNLEKIITYACLALLVVLGVVMINIRMTVSKVEQEISIIQDGVTQNEGTILQLEQEKNELSKSERIKKIADDQGLSITSDNLRKVKN
jgi:cell division protein FtsL